MVNLHEVTIEGSQFGFAHKYTAYARFIDDESPRTKYGGYEWDKQFALADNILESLLERLSYGIGVLLCIEDPHDTEAVNEAIWEGNI